MPKCCGECEYFTNGSGKLCKLNSKMILKNWVTRYSKRAEDCPIKELKLKKGAKLKNITLN